MTTSKLINGFEIPDWIGKPPDGTHLDVLKDDQLIQKLMIDQKGCYLFGRNSNDCDFQIEHSSASRVHAALLWHQKLNRAFIVDLQSSHGTFVGTLKLEPFRPQQIPSESIFHFGASSRCYAVRGRPKQEVVSDGGTNPFGNLIPNKNELKSKRLRLNEAELDNLTEFNTTRNRKINYSLKNDGAATAPRKRSSKSVSFCEEDEIINMDDFDPTVGRYRNLVEVTMIPKKRKVSFQTNLKPGANISKDTKKEQPAPLQQVSLAAQLNIGVPDLAPNIDDNQAIRFQADANRTNTNVQTDLDTTKKKKYAKEAWPGKTSNLLV